MARNSPILAHLQNAGTLPHYHSRVMTPTTTSRHENVLLQTAFPAHSPLTPPAMTTFLLLLKTPRGQTAVARSRSNSSCSTTSFAQAPRWRNHSRSKPARCDRRAYVLYTHVCALRRSRRAPRPPRILPASRSTSNDYISTSTCCASKLGTS